jgi:hypothetical protein
MPYVHVVRAVDLGVQVPLPPVRVEVSFAAVGIAPSLLQVRPGRPESAAQGHEVDLRQGLGASGDVRNRRADETASPDARW